MTTKDDVIEHIAAHTSELARQEVCTCGHTRAMHEGTFAECLCYPLVQVATGKGYGKRCACVRFTWDAKSDMNQKLLAQAKERAPR